MPIQFGDFRLPTLGDAISGGEAMIGNLIEGVVEGVTGEKVELTPGVGVDNTRIDNGRGSKRDIKFEEKMASFSEVERMRRELEKELNSLRSEVTKLKVREAANKKLMRPAVMPNPGNVQGASSFAQNNNSMNPMLMLMLSRDGDVDPLMMMLMMQTHDDAHDAKHGRKCRKRWRPAHANGSNGFRNHADVFRRHSQTAL